MKSKKINKVKLVVIIILSIFVTLNIIWFAYIQKIYVPYKDGLSKGSSFGRYYSIKGNFGIGLTYPTYLDFKHSGNISLTYNTEECGASLLVWPKTLIGNKETRYGLELYEHTQEDGNNGLTLTCTMYVDENGYPIEKTSENIAVYEKYRKTIDEIFQEYNNLT